jgi:hypothetical protein
MLSGPAHTRRRRGSYPAAGPGRGRHGPGLTGRPGHRAAAEDVRVGVVDGLAPVVAGVEDDAVSGIGDPLGDRYSVRLVRDLFQEAVAGGRDRRHIGIMFFRYNQNVRRCLRIDIAKRDSPRAFPHRFRRDVTGHDPAEQAVSHGWILSFQPAFVTCTSLPALLGDVRYVRFGT